MGRQGPNEAKACVCHKRQESINTAFLDVNGKVIYSARRCATLWDGLTEVCRLRCRDNVLDEYRSLNAVTREIESGRRFHGWMDRWLAGERCNRGQPSESGELAS